MGELFGVAPFTGSFLSPITEMERGNKSASGRHSYLSKYVEQSFAQEQVLVEGKMFSAKERADKI